MATTKSKKSVVKKTASKILVKPVGFDEVKSTNLKTSKLKLSRKYLVILLLLVLAGGIYLARGLFVVATVGGFPITRFQIIRELEKESGKRVLENIVTKELINQEVKKKNITVSDEDVQKQIDEIKKGLEAQGTTLEAALTTQGQTMNDLKANIKLQKSAELLLADKTAVTEDDVRKYYDENKDTFDKTAKYEDLKAQIESQLKSQIFQTEIEKYLTDLKAQYKINYFVSY
ncbi:MAG: Foldase protein PrsA [Microgenomates group bacterium GW2011_GWC1_37_12b]|uniref:Foldase protein PrsA n=2 Tax=Candidatus Woeseibacteriota TaxID=1752722 RepID=A0A0G0LHF6_9BACT|nr:MAG: Foldase protein PrsA [Microgenomates group bacterium GW2011_GWC1_37_12b]KKQ87365.1 MAG: Foldase protein PrsA [Candidatus Woesebacteria bacterium GW2011_GWB1_38_8b]